MTDVEKRLIEAAIELLKISRLTSRKSLTYQNRCDGVIDAASAVLAERQGERLRFEYCAPGLVHFSGRANVFGSLTLDPDGWKIREAQGLNANETSQLAAALRTLNEGGTL